MARVPLESPWWTIFECCVMDKINGVNNIICTGTLTNQSDIVEHDIVTLGYTSKTLKTLQAFIVLIIFKFLFWLFGHVGKQLYKKGKVNIKVYDATNC